MDDSTHSLLQVIQDYWIIISAFVAFLVGYVELRFKVRGQDARLDRLENDLKDDMKEIRNDIKTLLARVGE